jgi:hypothetical protein
LNVLNAGGHRHRWNFRRASKLIKASQPATHGRPPRAGLTSQSPRGRPDA